MEYKIKMAVFDVDGTLSIPYTPIPWDISKRLMELERAGVIIAFASGKNSTYLRGMARGMGIDKPVLIAENGISCFDCITNEHVLTAERSGKIHDIEKELLRRFGKRIHNQENQVMIAMFPRYDDNVLFEIAGYLEEQGYRDLDDIRVYVHEDAVDVMPASVDKSDGLLWVREKHGLDRMEVISVGDGLNDLPLAKESRELLFLDRGMHKLPGGIDNIRLVPDIKGALSEIESMVTLK